MSMREKQKVSIYYDENCRFCQRSVELIVKWFRVNTLHVGPAQADKSILETMWKYDSWVAVNNNGERFTTFQAGVEIAKCSPILSIFVPLSKPKFMQKFGEWTYRKIAQNRHHLWLP